MMYRKFERIQGDYIPRQLEFHPRKEGLVFGTIAGEVCYVDLKTKDLKYIGHTGLTRDDRIFSLCWLNHANNNSNQDLLFSGSSKGRLSLVDMSKEEPRVVDFPHDSGEICCIDANSDGSQILVSGDNTNLRIYDVETSRESMILHDIHTNQMNNSKFFRHSPHMLCTSSFDKTIKTWDLRTSLTTPCYTIQCPSEVINIHVSKEDDKLLASGCGREVNQYCLTTGQHIRQQSLPPNRFTTTDFSRGYYSASNELIYSINCGIDCHVHITDTLTGQYLSSIYMYPDCRDATTLYLQTLRGSPRQEHSLCVLVYYESVPYQDLVYITPDTTRMLKHHAEDVKQAIAEEMASSSSATPIAATMSLTDQMEAKITTLHTESQCTDFQQSLQEWQNMIRKKADVLREKQVAEHRLLQESLLCAVCQVERKAVALQPCGHVCLCQGCCNTILYHATKKACPLCNRAIEQHFKVYI